MIDRQLSAGQSNVGRADVEVNIDRATGIQRRIRFVNRRAQSTNTIASSCLADAITWIRITRIAVVIHDEAGRTIIVGDRAF